MIRSGLHLAPKIGHEVRVYTGFFGHIHREKPATRAGCTRETIVRDAYQLATENANTVVDMNSSSGRSSVDGKSGWFGESGKCCVSRQKASVWR
jgi:hypothetical protein